MGMATTYNNEYKHQEFDPATVLPGQAFHHNEFKWIRFVTFYHGDAWFEYWEMERFSKVQKLGIFDVRDNWKRFPEKDYIEEENND